MKKKTFKNLMLAQILSLLISSHLHASGVQDIESSFPPATQLSFAEFSSAFNERKSPEELFDIAGKLYVSIDIENIEHLSSHEKLHALGVVAYMGDAPLTEVLILHAMGAGHNPLTTAAAFAASGGRFELSKALILKYPGQNLEAYVIHQALFAGYIDFVLDLIHENPLLIDHAFFSAAVEWNICAFDLLLDRFPDKIGKALSASAAGGNAELTQELLESNPSTQDIEDALLSSTTGEVTELLLGRSPSMEAIDNAFEEAIHQKKKEVALCLSNPDVGGMIPPEETIKILVKGAALSGETEQLSLLSYFPLSNETIDETLFEILASGNVQTLEFLLHFMTENHAPSKTALKNGYATARASGNEEMMYLLEKKLESQRINEILTILEQNNPDLTAETLKYHPENLKDAMKINPDYLNTFLNMRPCPLDLTNALINMPSEDQRKVLKIFLSKWIPFSYVEEMISVCSFMNEETIVECFLEKYPQYQDIALDSKKAGENSDLVRNRFKKDDDDTSE